MLSLGAQGVVSVASHLEGAAIKKMIQTFKKGDVAQARRIHASLYPLFRTLFMTTNPMPVKEALYQRHLIDSPELRTMGEMSPDDKRKLGRELHNFETLKAIRERNNLLK